MLKENTKEKARCHLSVTSECPSTSLSVVALQATTIYNCKVSLGWPKEWTGQSWSDLAGKSTDLRCRVPGVEVRGMNWIEPNTSGNRTVSCDKHSYRVYLVARLCARGLSHVESMSVVCIAFAWCASINSDGEKLQESPNILVPQPTDQRDTRGRTGKRSYSNGFQSACVLVVELT